MSFHVNANQDGYHHLHVKIARLVGYVQQDITFPLIYMTLRYCRSTIDLLNLSGCSEIRFGSRPNVLPKVFSRLIKTSQGTLIHYLV